MSAPERVDSKIRIAVLIINLSFNILILSPIAVYYFLDFNKLSNDSQFMWIKKRYPSIIKITCILCLIILLFERNIVSFLVCNLVDIFGEYFIKTIWRLSRIIYPIHSCVNYCGLWRFWHIFYDLNILKAVNESSWRKYLNSSLIENNWYLKNKGKYGLPHYTKKRVFILWLISSIIQIMLFQTFMFNDKYQSLIRLIDAIIYFIPVILCWIITYKAPSIDDKFYFKKEITYYSLISVAAILIYILAVLLQIVHLINPYYVQIILGFDCSSAIFCVSILQSAFIINKLKNIENNKEENQDITLREFISTQHGFDKFINHLQKEFSLEIMLSVIELTQFKKLVKKKLNLKEEDIKCKDESIAPILPSNLPKSQIVYGLFEDEAPKDAIDGISEIPDLVISDKKTRIDLKPIDKLKTIAFLLYKRYIAVNSELEINISCINRKRLNNILSNCTQLIKGDMNAKQLYTLFDPPIKEMMALMNCSYGRFKTTVTV